MINGQIYFHYPWKSLSDALLRTRFHKKFLLTYFGNNTQIMTIYPAFTVSFTTLFTVSFHLRPGNKGWIIYEYYRVNNRYTPFSIRNRHWSHGICERSNQIHKMSNQIHKKSKQNHKKSNQIRTTPNQICTTLNHIRKTPNEIHKISNEKGEISRQMQKSNQERIWFGVVRIWFDFLWFRFDFLWIWFDILQICSAILWIWFDLSQIPCDQWRFRIENGVECCGLPESLKNGHSNTMNVVVVISIVISKQFFSWSYEDRPCESLFSTFFSQKFIILHPKTLIYLLPFITTWMRLFCEWKEV